MTSRGLAALCIGLLVACARPFADPPGVREPQPAAEPHSKPTVRSVEFAESGLGCTAFVTNDTPYALAYVGYQEGSALAAYETWVDHAWQDSTKPVCGTGLATHWLPPGESLWVHASFPAGGGPHRVRLLLRDEQGRDASVVLAIRPD